MRCPKYFKLSFRWALAVAATFMVLVIPRDGLAQDATEVVDPILFQDLTYRMVGPDRGGRATTVAGHRDLPYTFYVGYSGGGVWKTDDAGHNWFPISDGFFETGSIGAIRVAPSNSDIVYVGTGSDGIRSNVIDGRGVYKSTDAGETWTHIGLREVGQIGAVEVHPTNPDVVYLAAMGNTFRKSEERGVYKTTDGGRTWDRILFTSDSVGAVDLELNPVDPTEIYVAMYRGERKPWTIISGMEASAHEDGIWKSSDGGENWRYISNGLPSGLIGKIDLAVTAADANRVYALVEAVDEAEGLYRSDDRGESWRHVSNQDGLMDRPFYFTNVDADPANADVVYVGSVWFYRSTDAGGSWNRIPSPHADHHGIWINPGNSNIFVQANDGGANVTLNNARTWSQQYNQPTAELYQVYVDDRFPYWIYGAQQDYTTMMVPSVPTEDASTLGNPPSWKAISASETGPSVPKPGNSAIIFSNSKGRFTRFSRITGQEQQYHVGDVRLAGHNPKDLPYRFQRVAPIEISLHNPDVLYHGSQYVHRTLDGGINWETISGDLTAFPPDRQVVSGSPITRDVTGEEYFSALYVIRESPVLEGVIWTGANDGPVHVTRDGGTTWIDVTPPMPPKGRIQHIDPSPHNPGKAYVAAYRLLLGDFEPYIFKTEDYGLTWDRLTDGGNGIPIDYPTRVVREDPASEGLLYAGTEFGIFISFDDGGHWQSFQKNLPATPVTDIKLFRGDLVLSTMGRSFWIMDNLSPLAELRAGIPSGNHLFTPLDQYRLRDGLAFMFGPTDPSAPVYFRNGAVIDYVMGESGGDIALEILDASGTVVRSYRGAGTESEAPRSPQAQILEARSFESTTPSSAPGGHRFNWDLRVKGPDGQPSHMALPGDYEVRLTIGDWSTTRPFELLIDPRVEADGVTLADLQAQFDFNTQVADLAAEANEFREAVDDVIESGNYVDRDLEELQAIRALMVNAEHTDPQPMFLSQVSYLRGRNTNADQRPGDFAYLRYEELVQQFADMKSRFEAVSGRGR